jgi:hypothetical protein
VLRSAVRSVLKRRPSPLCHYPTLYFQFAPPLLFRASVLLPGLLFERVECSPSYRLSPIAYRRFAYCLEFSRNASRNTGIYRREENTGARDFGKNCTPSAKSSEWLKDVQLTQTDIMDRRSLGQYYSLLCSLVTRFLGSQRSRILPISPSMESWLDAPAIPSASIQG